MNSKKLEQGSIIVFTMLMLGSILAITLTLTAIFLPKIRSISQAGGDSVTAIYAADGAVEWCLYMNRGNPALPQPVMSNGSIYTLTPSDCTAVPLDSRAVGTYDGVSRSLEVQTAQ